MGLGKVRWVAPSGLVGFGPLASVGPVSLGAGAAEKSSLEIPRVVVCVDPLQSLLQQKLILQLHADQAQVRSKPLGQPLTLACLLPCMSKPGKAFQRAIAGLALVTGRLLVCCGTVVPVFGLLYMCLLCLVMPRDKTRI